MGQHLRGFMFASLRVSAMAASFILRAGWVTVRWGLEEMFEMSAAVT